jgi:hypothetical protein
MLYYLDTYSCKFLRKNTIVCGLLGNDKMSKWRWNLWENKLQACPWVCPKISRINAPRRNISYIWPWMQNLWQYVIVIATQWSWGKESSYYNQYIFYRNRKLLLQWFLVPAPHFRIFALYIRILPQRFNLLQYLVSIATKWIIHATWCNCGNIATILQRWCNLWKYVASIATKVVLSVTKRNCGNIWSLLPRTWILW